jgi:hypothetical protein
LRTRDTAAVRGRVAYRREAANLARLQHHRLGQHCPAALDRHELLISGRVLQTLHDGFFQGFHLLAQTVQDRETAGDGQHLVGLGQHTLKGFLRELVNPLGTEAHARIAHEDILQTEHVRGLLAHQVGAFASRVPHGSCGFWVDVPLGQHA